MILKPLHNRQGLFVLYRSNGIRNITLAIREAWRFDFLSLLMRTFGAICYSDVEIVLKKIADFLCGLRRGIERYVGVATLISYRDVRS
jgi:hypothetical protein